MCSILRGLFILIPDLRLISLHGNSSQLRLRIRAEQILEAHFFKVDVFRRLKYETYGEITETTEKKHRSLSCCFERNPFTRRQQCLRSNYNVFIVDARL